jgi:hypothetical protein
MSTRSLLKVPCHACNSNQEREDGKEEERKSYRANACLFLEAFLLPGVCMHGILLKDDMRSPPIY